MPIIGEFATSGNGGPTANLHIVRRAGPGPASSVTLIFPPDGLSLQVEDRWRSHSLSCLLHKTMGSPSPSANLAEGNPSGSVRIPKRRDRRENCAGEAPGDEEGSTREPGHVSVSRSAEEGLYPQRMVWQGSMLLFPTFS